MYKLFMILKDSNFSPKIKTQLIFSFMGMSFIIITISSIFAYFGMVNILKKQSENENIMQFRQLEHNIITFRNEVDKISKMLIISPEMNDFLDESPHSDLERTEIYNNIYNELNNIINSYDYIDSIYFFGENGRIIGATAKYHIFCEDTDRRSEFYRSKVYNSAKAGNQHIVWQGGYTSEDFDMLGYNSEVKPKSYITAARSGNYLGKQITTLVINIREDYFTSIYNSLNENKDTVYLMTDEGVIISHRNEAQINKVSGVIQESGMNKNSGSLILQKGEKSKQIVYYRLANTNWILVNEIPFKQLIKDISELRRILVLLFFVSLAMAFAISMYWIFRITKPLNEITKAMRKMEKGELGCTIPENSRNELGLIEKQFNRMSGSTMELITKIKVMEKEKRNLELESLQTQINPHFLYNTLNTIKYMAVLIHANNIVESITVLGHILRPVFNNKSILCSIKDEVEYVKNYIQIMNLRFGEGIKVQIEIPDNILEYQILKFILQPIIENSISYGFAINNHKGTISIYGYENTGDIELHVEDDGAGMDTARLEEIRKALSEAKVIDGCGGSGIGIINVNRRMKLHFGEEYGLRINSTKGMGTKVVFCFPKSKDHNIVIQNFN